MNMRLMRFSWLLLIALGGALIPLQGFAACSDPAAAAPAVDQKKRSKTYEVRVEKKGGEEREVRVASADSCGEEMEKVMVVKIDRGEQIIKIKDGKIISATKNGKEIPLDQLKEEGIIDEALQWETKDGETKIITVRSSSEDSVRKRVMVTVKGDKEDIDLWQIDEEDASVDSCADNRAKKNLWIRIKEGDRDWRSASGDTVKKKVRIRREHGRMAEDSETSIVVGEEIRAELAKDGIIAGETDPVEFKLTGKGLWVNGVKQSDEAQRKYTRMIGERMGLEKDDALEIKLKYK
ncbi:MAG: hypothetical protein BWY83_02242 [bacterium ADurb.Bin478]|nr:MAG: hypothetical protein BWY83_02242 [bacterium ADurb.Bin478]